ncbi:hypothetical protein [Actinomycetospora sp. CA-084318]
MTTGTQQEVRDEVARLDGWLRARAVPDRPLGCTIRASDRDAVEAVADRYGYALLVRAVEEPDALWAEFRPVG